MDALINALNQRISSQVAGKNPATDNLTPAKTNFSEVLDSKRSNMMLEKLSEQISGEKQAEIRVISANEIQMTDPSFTSEKNVSLDPKQKLMDIFSGLNEDMVSLDASIEVLSDPNVKLSRRQLLAYQAGIGHMTINTELFSKMAQAVSQNLNTVLNTNVG